MKRHLVVCGSGVVGSFVIDVLLGKALHVRATTARKSQASERGPVAWTYVDLQTGEGVEQAFAGIHRAVLVLPAAMAKPQEAFTRCLLEAKRRRLEKLVLITDARNDATDDCQRALERSGLPHEVLRASAESDPRRLAAAAVEVLTRERNATLPKPDPDNPGVLSVA